MAIYAVTATQAPTLNWLEKACDTTELPLRKMSFSVVHPVEWSSSDKGAAYRNNCEGPQCVLVIETPLAFR